MTRFALRGLLSRKLRTALTALAIVLGVAMISGTFVLTDSIDQAFDKIFTDIRKGSSAVISGKSAFDSLGGQRCQPRRRSTTSLLEPGPGAARRGGGGGQRRQRDHAADRREREGDPVRSRRAPNLGFSIANPESRFNPLSLVSGAWPGPERGDDRQGDRGEEGSRGRRRDRDPGRGPGAAAPDLRDHAVQLGALDRRCDARRVRPSDRAAALREGGATRRDRSRGQAGHDGTRARSPDSRDPAGRNAGKDGLRSRLRRTRRTRTSSSRSCAPSSSRSAGSRCSSARS